MDRQKRLPMELVEVSKNLLTQFPTPYLESGQCRLFVLFFC